MAWDNVFLPKSYGGPGIRKLKHLDSALQAKKVWKIFSSTREWRDIMVDKYLRRPSLRHFLYEFDILTSLVIWNGILMARTLAKAKAKWKVRNGENILFW